MIFPIVLLVMATIVAFVMAVGRRSMLLNARAALPYRKAAIDIGVKLVSDTSLSDQARHAGSKIVELASQRRIRIARNAVAEHSLHFEGIEKQLVESFGGGAGEEIAQAIAILSVVSLLQSPLHGPILRSLGISNSKSLLDVALHGMPIQTKEVDGFQARKYAKSLVEGSPEIEKISINIGRAVFA
ncbi:hypothetical protein NKW53_05745 [Acetobacter orientalis]|uniref:hypothetical protein n=1 Tax=Acetobacter orientalis TaxID=146474 RepID=UPI00209D403D|nr:hypothetical protein [Acetobacter orientalis]MCP1215568.1 hypothetical protein [Acetobacter orientalis]MCP1217579.1 hypothetical protein [Acetobacter orientalis]